LSGFLIDTNVVSESMRPEMDPRVAAWITRQLPTDIFLSTTTVAELRAGIERLPSSRKRRSLDDWCNRLVNEMFLGQVLSFDLAAALAYGEVVAKARRTGRPAHVADAQIAAVASVHGLAVATRDIADFDGFGIALVNPFKAD